MIAKRFFYVSASVLLLALSHVMVTSVGHGQVGSTLVDADDPGRGSLAVTNLNEVYYALYPPDGSGATWQRKGIIPSSSPIVSIQSGEDNFVHAFAANGDFFVSANLGSTWQRKGNVFGMTTSGLPATWGSVKAKYRGSSER